MEMEMEIELATLRKSYVNTNRRKYVNNRFKTCLSTGIHKLADCVIRNMLGSSLAAETGSGEERCDWLDDNEPAVHVTAPAAATAGDWLSVHDPVATDFMPGYATPPKGLGSP